MKRYGLLLLSLSLIVLWGCSARQGKMAAEGDSGEYLSLAEDAAVSNLARSSSSPAMASEPSASTELRAKKLIKNARLAWDSKDLSSSLAQLRSLVGQYAGQIEREQQSFADGEEGASVSLTLKIPGERFDEFLSTLEGQAKRFTQREVWVDDVTADYYDLDLQLRSQRALSERYLALLGQASKVEDLLSIERELSRVRSGIERLEARLRDYDKRVAYSTVSVTISEEKVVSHLFSGFGSRFAKALKGGVDKFLALFFGLLGLWPILLLLGLGAYLWRRRIKVRERSK